MFILCDHIDNRGFPIPEHKNSNSIYVGNIKPYKCWFCYETIKKSSKRLKVKFQENVALIFGLNNDNRFYINGDFSLRKWNQLSKPFQCRATILFGLLNNNKDFLIPSSKFLGNLWLSPGYKEIFHFLLDINCNIYVYKNNCEWITQLEL